jgi:hypothetical protein
MKTQRLLTVLTLVNFALLIFALTETRTAAAEANLGVLRGRGLEIVDERGRIRASITILPAKTQPNGDSYQETVLLRLITERGRPSVKLGASEQSSGMSLAGTSGTKDTYVVLKSEGQVSSLRLRNEDRREQVVQP